MFILKHCEVIQITKCESNELHLSRNRFSLIHILCHTLCHHIMSSHYHDIQFQTNDRERNLRFSRNKNYKLKCRRKIMTHYLVFIIFFLESIKQSYIYIYISFLEVQRKVFNQYFHLKCASDILFSHLPYFIFIFIFSQEL